MTQRETDDDELVELDRTQKEAATYLGHRAKALQSFLDGELIIRTHEKAPPKEPSATPSAFALFYLAQANLIAPEGVKLAVEVLSATQATAVTNKVGAMLEARHPDVPSESSPVKTKTARLPNQYNSSIYAAGYLRACRALEITPPDKVLEACGRIMKYLRESLDKNRGYVTRLEEGSHTPSAYMTFWATTSLDEWMTAKHHVDVIPENKCLATAARWAEGEIANAIAYHQAGVLSRCDIVELIYSSLICIKFGATADRRRLAKSAFDLIFEHHFRNGCFGPSAPVFADTHNYSLLCSTAEALSLVLNTAPWLMHAHWRKLYEVLQWLHDHDEQSGNSPVEPRGWYSEWDGRLGRETAFMTVSALSYLTGVEKVFDDVLRKKAAVALRVPDGPAVNSVPGYQYPENLGRILRSHVILPQQDRKHRHLASYSLILYGPPGSSKTTIAKQLAQDLKWPLLVLNQSEFLRGGMEKLDAEAGRLFQLVSYLKDTVVLFDEVEELVQERGGEQPSGRPDKLSRLLTTSMLPRIADLRDRKRVVFLFATNHVDSIDVAIARLGRFDIVRCVLPPEAEERRKMLNSLADKSGLPDVAKTELTSSDTIEQTRNFGFLDLSALVQRIQIAVQVDNVPFDTRLVTDGIKVGGRAVNVKLVEEFRKKREAVDRP